MTHDRLFKGVGLCSRWKAITERLTEATYFVDCVPTCHGLGSAVSNVCLAAVSCFFLQRRQCCHIVAVLFRLTCVRSNSFSACLAAFSLKAEASYAYKSWLPRSYAGGSVVPLSVVIPWHTVL
jgi:hypothetical protein